MDSKPEKVSITFEAPAGLARALDESAAKNLTSRSGIIRAALVAHLNWRPANEEGE